MQAKEETNKDPCPTNIPATLSAIIEEERPGELLFLLEG
jgi:hypothetical protein